jgi:glycosyltransferase involved in cell wall biosynthesis
VRFSIVVPTLNRPELLREALSSIAAQTYGDWEAVVVDDGSDPPLERDALTPVVGPERLTLVRHDRPGGIPAAKNAGLDAAAGDVVLYLDDDDLLSPGALETLHALFRKHPRIDCIFANVEPFGRHADGTRVEMDRAFGKFLARAAPAEDEDLYHLGASAFEALLQSVPLALQRPAARRSAWNMVGGYCDTVPFSEPEWAMRAAASCRMAVTKVKLQRWRVDGQNWYSRPEHYKTGIESGIGSLRALRETFARQERVGAEREAMVTRRLARSYLSRAWFVWESEGRTDFEALWLSFWTVPSVAPIRFLLRNAFLAVVGRRYSATDAKGE